MTKDAQIDQLVQNGYAAFNRNQNAHAALLFGQARALAIEIGTRNRAFGIGALEVNALERSEGFIRYITLLSSLLQEIPEEADPIDIYWVKCEYLWYLTYYAMDPRLDKLIESLQDLEGVCRSAGPLYAGQIEDWRAKIALHRGMWQEAVTRYEVSWSNPRLDFQGCTIPGEIIQSLLRLGKADDAHRWAASVTSRYSPSRAQTVASHIRVLMALHDNDAAACRGAVLAADDSISGTQWVILRAEHIRLTALALVLDDIQADPLAPGHPSSLRLAEFSKQNISESSYVASLLHETAIILKIAGLRYATGMDPVDDLYYRKPHQLQPRSKARLPDSIPARVATARDACDAALPLASRLDKGFQCTYRQDDITAWRARIDQIAAVYSL
jgi:hypothetical protein